MKNMFLHDFKVACRSLLKYKLQTVISVVGLAVGLSCFVICNKMFRDELRWNHDLPHVENIYFLAPAVYTSDAIIGKDIVTDFRNKFPEIEHTLTFLNSPYTDKNCVVEDSKGGQRWQKESFLYSDSSFMDFFDFKLLQGNVDVVKKQPNALILTESAAIRVFGTTDVVGKTFMDINDFRNTEKECKVLGVIEDFPRQTYFNNVGGLVLNTTEEKVLAIINRGGLPEELLFRLNENVSIDDLNIKIGEYLKSRPEQYKDNLSSLKLHHLLQLHSYYSGGNNLSYFLIFSGVGLLVLLTAIFNYVMFMSGRILNRQKEYGIRQINGANSMSIFRMFSMEITLYISLAVFGALIFIELFSHRLSQDLGEIMLFDDKHNWLLVLGLYLLEYTIFVWLAMLGICWLILRHFRTLPTLQHIQGGGVRYKNRMANLLLGLQLVICILLGGGAYFLYAQQEFLEKHYRGALDVEECKKIYDFSLSGDKFKPIRTDFQNILNANPYIEESCRTGSGLLTHSYLASNKWEMEGLKNKSTQSLLYLRADVNYPEFINTRMEEGRFFRADEANCAVVNMEFVRHFGNPLGKEITINFNNWQTFRIVGVIEDIMPTNTRLRLNPSVYLPYSNGMDLTYSVKLVPSAKSVALESLKAKMREQLHISTPLFIETLDENIDRRLKNLREMRQLLFLLVLICIVICLLGIYSSMMLAVEKRGREMAIRKINGARLVDIANIFVRRYFVLLGVATLIAFPILYLEVQTLLEYGNHDIRVSITVFPFIGIFIVLFAIVLLTIGSQLIKIMRINPVEKLKSE